MRIPDLVNRSITVSRADWAAAGEKVAAQGSNLSEMARLCAALIAKDRMTIAWMRKQLEEEEAQ